MSGSLGSLSVTASEEGLSLKGSLPKWYLKDNLHDLSRGDTQRAIEALSDTLHLPIGKALIRRADFACHWLMKYKPNAYYLYFGEAQYYKRLVQPESVYYSNAKRTMLFYDKVAESKSKGVVVPHLFQDRNLLRYELRLMSRLPEQFNKAQVLASDLYDQDFYINLIDKWAEEYQRIYKIPKMSFNATMLEPKDIFTQLLLSKIQEMGGSDAIVGIIEEARHKGQFKRPEYASRAKAMLKELSQTPNLTEPSELIKELDSRVKEVRRHYR